MRIVAFMRFYIISL